jgi:hypothetical protein
MTTKDRIDKLVSLCKGSVTINFNEHATNYETIEEYLRDSMFNRFDDVAPDLKKEIIKAGLVVEVQAYPRTPVGFILAVHHDLDKALDDAIEGAENY